MKYFLLIFAMATLVGVSILAAFIPAGMDLPGRWCASDDIPSRCLSGWLASYSGWAAAFGAFAVAFITLGPLREQVREAKRQSDFLVGDAEPEFVLLRNRKEKRVVLRLTNWNRRTVMVEHVKCIAPDDLQVFNMLDLKDSPTWEEQSRTRKIPAFRTDGWYNRAKAPPRRNFITVFSRRGEPQQNIAEEGAIVTVRISYRVVGQVHERRECEATMLDLPD